LPDMTGKDNVQSNKSQKGKAAKKKQNLF